jgi:membrane-bound ClpP family serine protease
MAKEKQAADFAFGKVNYTIMLIGIGLILLGFILMAGGGTKDPNEFSEAIFNTQRITIAPILVLSGFVLEIYAIVKKSKD